MAQRTDIGAAIRARRQARGLTLQDLADAIGRNRATVSRYETGHIDIPWSELARVADALSTSVVALVKPRRAA